MAKRLGGARALGPAADVGADAAEAPTDAAAQPETFEAHRLGVTRGARSVLRDIDLALAAGELLCLLGANGAGKSSFLSALAGELAPQPAAPGCEPIRLNGRALAELDAATQARARAVLPQRPGLGFDLTVDEVVGMGAYPFAELSPREVEGLLRRALGLAGMAGFAQRRYLELSGGEQQRVQFARVLLQALAGRGADSQARYILLDEPTSSLDPLHQQELLRAVADVARAERIGALVVLHDLNLAASWADRIVLLADGVVLACGTPAEVLTAEHIWHAYGIEAEILQHPRRPQRPLVVFA
ncbi:heme ABC transporter ATP-binding protein [Candidimonas humi]|uniref:Heme ABC transporter ATP-binding protein n=1 Tax=Candidimonas humi TaxID=683355 RepID=A0ABV8NVI3_9BURK|nr:heme ABC transporter ATP-binding protein [Candidimonas humi]MBV6305119.1 heme ABC transporter ATP-binding protein [Candidimonas humi]